MPSKKQTFKAPIKASHTPQVAVDDSQKSNKEMKLAPSETDEGKVYHEDMGSQVEQSQQGVSSEETTMQFSSGTPDMFSQDTARQNMVDENHVICKQNTNSTFSQSSATSQLNTEDAKFLCSPIEAVVPFRKRQIQYIQDIEMEGLVKIYSGSPIVDKDVKLIDEVKGQQELQEPSDTVMETIDEVIKDTQKEDIADKTETSQDVNRSENPKLRIEKKNLKSKMIKDNTMESNDETSDDPNEDIAPNKKQKLSTQKKTLKFKTAKKLKETKQELQINNKDEENIQDIPQLETSNQMIIEKSPATANQSQIFESQMSQDSIMSQQSSILSQDTMEVLEQLTAEESKINVQDSPMMTQESQTTTQNSLVDPVSLMTPQKALFSQNSLCFEPLTTPVPYTPFSVTTPYTPIEITPLIRTLEDTPRNDSLLETPSRVGEKSSWRGSGSPSQDLSQATPTPSQRWSLASQETPTDSLPLSQQRDRVINTPRPEAIKSVLATCPSSLSQRERIMWLMGKRCVGLWALCTRCNKYRYLPDVCDPCSLPRAGWTCGQRGMSCAAPEETPSPLEQEHFLVDAYNAGSVVWARQGEHPWWPAMVDDDPELETFFSQEDGVDNPKSYHVTFFDSKAVTRAWLPANRIKRFEISTQGIHPNKSVPEHLRSRLAVAETQARQALREKNHLARLRTWSFVSRYTGAINPPKSVEELMPVIRRLMRDVKPDGQTARDQTAVSDERQTGKFKPKARAVMKYKPRRM